MAARRIIAALILLASLGSLSPTAAQTFRDEYQTGGFPDLTGRTVRMPETVGGGPCEDTARHDSYYGSKPVRVVIERVRQFEPDVISGLIFYARCAVDLCDIRGTMLCWPRRDIFSTRADLFEPDQPSRLITFDKPPIGDRFETGDDRRQQQSHVPNVPRRDDERGPGDCLEPPPSGVATALADVRRRLEIAQAKADATNDRFVSESVRVLTGHVAWLAQPHGKPSEEVWRGITQAPGNVWGAVVAYWTNDREEIHQQLGLAAQQALAQAQRDPWGAAGWFTGQVALGGVTGAGAPSGRCPANPAAAQRVTVAMRNAQKAAQRIGEVAEAGESFGANGANWSCPRFPHWQMIEDFAPQKRLNPKGHKSACVGTTLADSLDRDFRSPATIDELLPPNMVGRGLDREEVKLVLKAFAEKTPVPKGMKGARLHYRERGIPTPKFSPRAVEQEIREAGGNARFAVMVRMKPGFADVHGNGSHMFTGFNNPLTRQIEFYDAESGIGAAHWFDNAAQIWTFRLK